MTRDEIVDMVAEVDFQFLGKQNWNAFDKYEAFAKLVAEKTVEGKVVMTPEEYKSVWDKAQAEEREACELIEYDLAKSPAMFATMAEYKAYKDGVQDYRTKIIARGEA